MVAADADSRLLDALVCHLGEVPARLYRSYLERGQTMRQYRQLVRSGWHASKALTVAEFCEQVGDVLKRPDLSSVAQGVHREAKELLDRDRKDERQRWRDMAEEDIEFRKKAERESKERWSMTEWCSINDICLHLMPPRSVAEVQELLRAHGYIEGVPGAYCLTSKGLVEGVAKVEIKGPKQGLVLWSKTLFERLRLELEASEPSS